MNDDENDSDISYKKTQENFKKEKHKNS